MSFLAIALGGASLYAAFLYGLHVFFTRQQGARIAAGAVFRSRVRKHVYRGGIWS
ncbi:hypothetical protein [Mesorhizobium sp.]|uniref:hypothetical protein n=1 Tax=Mesorhizobium sp. TaxID=1871066 RepID=UPI0025FDE251|nr:hypothetical protein [Mesorhizobium sp.]